MSWRRVIRFRLPACQEDHRRQTKQGLLVSQETIVTVRNGQPPVWQLALLGELAVPADDRIKAEAERFLDLHQAESGSFVCPSKV